MAPHRQTTAHSFQFTLPTEFTMATVYPAARDEFCTSLYLVLEATTARVIPSTATKTEVWWLIWLEKCTEREINPIQDPSSTHTADYLVVFAHKVHIGFITLSGKLCRLGNMEAALCAIGQRIALLGPTTTTHAYSQMASSYLPLKCQFQSYKKEDPLPTCIEPLPVKLMKLAVQAWHYRW